MDQKNVMFCLNDEFAISVPNMKHAYLNFKIYWKAFRWAPLFITLIIPLIPFLTTVPILQKNINITVNNETYFNLVYNKETPKSLDFKSILNDYFPILHAFFFTFSFFYVINFVINIFWERRNFMYRHDNYNSMLKNVSHYHPNFGKAFFTLFVTLSIPWFCPNIDILCIIICFNILVVIHNVPITSSKWCKLQQTQKLDHSRALAEWYYHGYLENVLSLDTDQPFKGRILSFEDAEGKEIQVHKLIILMPTSCFVHNNLGEIDPKIEHFKNMLDLKSISVKNRTYRMSVYRVITKEGKWVNFLAEIAAPLKNINDCHVPKFSLSKSNKCELVCNFYLHLKKLLESNLKLAGSYILVPYKDQDNRGKTVELSQVLLNIIEQEMELTDVVVA